MSPGQYIVTLLHIAYEHDPITLCFSNITKIIDKSSYAPLVRLQARLPAIHKASPQLSPIKQV